MIYFHHYASPLGSMTLVSDGKALTELWFNSQIHCEADRAGWTVEIPLPVFDQADRWLNVYFSGCAPDFTPPLLLRGTAFRQDVWRQLLTIPYGRTVSYKELAARLGMSRDAARAVGAAAARNPLALIVPCHRVVGARGELTGYAGGLERKAWLLSLERGENPAPL